MTQLELYFEFIQYSLGVKEELPAMTADIDWTDFYQFAKKQSLLGVVFDGIARLPKELAPDVDLLMKWMGNSMAIKKRNVLMYQASEEVYSEVRKAGFRCCILKGQGNAIAYPNQYSRTAGDVDVWVLAENRKGLKRLALGLADSPSDVSREIVQHIELGRNGVSVELHPTPMMFNNPILNHRMQRWFKRNADLQCSNLIGLPEDIGKIAIPTAIFNAIYQLSHLYHHFFDEGVEFRQIIDYYYVIDGLPQIAHANIDLAVLQRELKHLGLWKFAGAVMYVLHEVLGLTEDKMIAPLDEKEGNFLLGEIMRGGNFGQYDTRLGSKKDEGKLHRYLRMNLRNLRFVKHYPTEALSEPLFRTWFAVWKKMHGIR